MAPLSAETCTLLLVILGAAALLRIPGVLFSIIKRYWKSYDDIPPAVIERMEAVGRLLPYWLELRKHPQFPTEVREQIELLAEVKERYITLVTNFQGHTNLLCRFTYTLLWIQMRDRERGWFPLRESWEDREIFVEVAKTLVRQADDHTPVSASTLISKKQRTLQYTDCRT